MSKGLIKIFVGSYTEFPTPSFGGTGEGIYTLTLDKGSGVVELKSTTVARNPSYLTLSDDHRYLYSHTEYDEKDVPKVMAISLPHQFPRRTSIGSMLYVWKHNSVSH